MAKHGKKYQETIKLLDRTMDYTPREAIELAKKMAYSRFDEAVELHLRLGVDTRDANQQVRGVALLPYGLGKKVRVLVFAQGEAEKIAETAGADYVGNDELIQKVEDGWVDFETALATPEMMSKIGKLGKVLGRRGLMPSPKSGTVVSADDLAQVIEDARKGRVEFRPDRTAIIHVPLGKVSFEDDELLGNLAVVVDAVIKAKPAGAKGQYLKSASLTTTMGAGIKLDLNSILTLSPD